MCVRVCMCACSSKSISHNFSLPTRLCCYTFCSTRAYCLQSFRESITSVAGGVVGSVDHDEIVVGTYNGQIIGLTSRTSLQQIASISDETKAKVDILR